MAGEWGLIYGSCKLTSEVVVHVASPSSVSRVPVFLHPCQHLVLSVFNFSHPGGFVVVSQYGFNFHIPADSWRWTSFLVFIWMPHEVERLSCAYWPLEYLLLWFSKKISCPSSLNTLVFQEFFTFLESGPSSGLCSVYFPPSLWIAFFFFFFPLICPLKTRYFLILMNFNLSFFFFLLNQAFCSLRNLCTEIS